MTSLPPWLPQLLEWTLRLFGLFWMVGGVLALQEARQAHLIDRTLEAISGEPEEPLVTRFLLLGGVLTWLSGAALAAASLWALLPISLLILSQRLYFAIQQRRFERAADEEAREDARVTPATRNAFWVSVLVAVLTVVAALSGALR